MENGVRMTCILQTSFSLALFLFTFFIASSGSVERLALPRNTSTPLNNYPRLLVIHWATVCLSFFPGCVLPSGVEPRTQLSPHSEPVRCAGRAVNRFGSEELWISVPGPDYRPDTLSITHPIPWKLRKGHLRAFYGVQCTLRRLVTQHVEGGNGMVSKECLLRGNEKWIKSHFASAIYTAMEWIKKKTHWNVELTYMLVYLLQRVFASGMKQAISDALQT